ncbi:MAG: hypothetical protein R3Y57_05490 [Erysipelotrichaceae bacterium]
MKQLKKILYKFNHRSLLKEKGVKKYIAQAQKDLSVFEIKNPVKTINDYFELSIIHTSLNQKQLLEQTYEGVRQEMVEIWEQLDFKQKNKFSNDQLIKVKQQLVHFIDQEKIIHVCFFDPIINALYDHEMAVFELPQFFKLLSDFKKEFKSINNYHLEPYRYGFCKEVCIYDDEKVVVLLNANLHQLYFIDTDLRIEVVGLCNCLNLDEVKAFVQLYLQNEESLCIQYLLNSTLVHDKAKKKLQKLAKKVENA